jgi:excinuclease ABC subunit C
MSSGPETFSHLQEILAQMPESPGVYQYFDSKGSLLYIGKAKNLKKRVKSYFLSGKSHSYRIATMVAKIHDIRYTIVNNEVEALTLENNLIKAHQPKYNINLKDGKTYPYICIKNEPFPRVFPTRNKTEDGSSYFGPYTSVKTMHAILDLIKRNYKFRSCNLSLTKPNIQSGKFKICLEFQIGNCFGPCEGLYSEDQYKRNIDDVKSILKGNFKTILGQLESQMFAFAGDYKFEKAEEIRRQIEDIKSFKRKNTIVSESITDVEVLATDRMNDLAVVTHFHIVNGSIVASHAWEWRIKLEEADEELLIAVVNQLKREGQALGNEIISSHNFEFPDEENPIPVRIPLRGEKHKLLELALKNCRTLLEEKVWKQNQSKASREDSLMQQMQQDLHLTTLPKHIECFDNSNIQGEYPVASLVVFRDGKPSKKDYRHFKIKTVTGPNDFASMEEIVYRRYSRLIEENQTLPDLVIVDGGKGQLSSAAQSIEKLGLNTKLPLIGIAKRLEEIYVVNDPHPLLLDKRSTTLRVIQQIRNEAHRFAITFHRDLRSKNTIATKLTTIPGIGEVIAKKLLSHFKSVNKVKTAGFEELAAVIGKAKAQILIAAIQSNTI